LEDPKNRKLQNKWTIDVCKIDQMKTMSDILIYQIFFIWIILL
jgi:hypothetical protein